MGITTGILISHFLCIGQSNEVDYKNMTTWEDVLNVARVEKKSIFIDVYATWCAQCKKMDAETLIEPMVYQHLNSKYISLKIQIDTSKNDDTVTKLKYGLAKKISTDYNVKSVPTFLFISSQGELLHREQGFFSSDSMISIFAVAENPQKNLKSWMEKWREGTLKGKELLEYSLKLKTSGYDSLSRKVIKSYKKNFLDKQPLSQTLNVETLNLFRLFPDLYSSHDSLIRYIYYHQKQVDDLINLKNFSYYTVEYILIREIITPEIEESEKKHKQPNWVKAENKIMSQWDSTIARNAILNSKVRYYYAKEDWENVVKYQIQNLDRKLNKIGDWEAFEFNVFVWEILLKHSSDTGALKIGKGYMEKVLETFPKDYSKMDTYANVLYRLGEKDNAIKFENHALTLAKEKKDSRSIKLYEETIQKMENNLPIPID